MARSNTDDEEVISIDISIGNGDLFERFVDFDHFAHDHCCIFLMPENFTQGCCYFSGRKSGCCNLIKQGLKKVMVCLIDENDIEFSMVQRLGGIQPCKSSSNDDNFRIRHVLLPV